MVDHKSPVDRAIDLFIYAPVGLALDARTLLPQLIDRGHDQLVNQVAMARMMGQFAVQQGQNEAGRQLAKLGKLGLVPKPASSRPAPAPRPAAAAEQAAPPRQPRSRQDPEAEPLAGEAIDADTLAIPGYDSLAASHVIPRLEGLAAEELEAVRCYEAANRGRKTILNKIAQLQG